jgi:hypothetical protein
LDLFVELVDHFSCLFDEGVEDGWHTLQNVEVFVIDVDNHVFEGVLRFATDQAHPFFLFLLCHGCLPFFSLHLPTQLEKCSLATNDPGLIFFSSFMHSPMKRLYADGARVLFGRGGSVCCISSQVGIFSTISMTSGCLVERSMCFITAQIHEHD